MRTVIYPGSFDPLTNGHLDLVHRAAKLFDKVIVAVALNEGKNPLFPHHERLELMRHAITDLPNVSADAFDPPAASLRYRSHITCCDSAASIPRSHHVLNMRRFRRMRLLRLRVYVSAVLGEPGQRPVIFQRRVGNRPSRG